MNLRRYVTLTDEKARHVIGTLAFVLAGAGLIAIAFHTWGQRAINAVAFLAIAWMFWEIRGVLGKTEAIEAHIAGTETPGSGRHSRRAA